MSIFFLKSHNNYLRHCYSNLYINTIKRLPIYLCFISFKYKYKGVIYNKFFKKLKYINNIKLLNIGTIFEPYTFYMYEHYKKSLKDMDRLFLNIKKKEKVKISIFFGIRKKNIITIDRSRHIHLLSYPEMFIISECNFFDIYIKKLPKSHENSIRRNIKIFCTNYYKLSFEKKTEFNLTYLYQQYLYFYKNAQVKWYKCKNIYFEYMLFEKNKIKIVLSYSRNLISLGFGMNYFDYRKIYIGKIGINEKKLKKNSIYFVLFYYLIDNALRRYSFYISLGPTSYKIKKYIGGIKIKQYNLIYISNKIIKFLFSLFEKI